ncbi:MAG TPA: DUF1905 domain-containing protein [Fimbriimonadaceae bacterium]|nr:DUF1905 domain-containing protein [Fimbriimonadaceae bacterium]
MFVEVTGEVWYWRGPAPFYFVTVPEQQADEIHAISKFVTYGWGCIPCDVTIGRTTYCTALFPKDGLYLVPVKAAVRKAENIEEGDTVSVRIEIAENGRDN